MLCRGHSSLTQSEHRRLYLQGAHSHCDSRSYICMHKGTHNLIDTYRTEHWPPILCLARSRVVMCLSQRVPPASSSFFIGFLFRDLSQRHPCVCVCICTACHAQWNQSFNNKCGISWQPRSSDVPIYGAHAWPVRMLCFLLCQMLGLGWGHLFS